MTDKTFKFKLPSGEEVIVDHEDREVVGHTWCALRPGPGNVTYAQADIKGERVTLHRLLLGLDDPDIITDHINGNGLDNRKVNLRTCTKAENGRNSGPRGGTSKFKGVSKYRGKWHAQIMADRTQYHLGYHENEVEAAKAYDEAAEELHGEFAWLNRDHFPEVAS